MSLWTEGEVHAGEVSAEKWNPLEDGPMPDYIPPRWDSPHVIRRYTEALDLLKHTPLGRIFPKDAQTCWPSYPLDWNTFMGRMSADVTTMAVEGKLDAEFVAAYQDWTADRNRYRDLPTREQLSEMNRALRWHVHYLWSQPKMRLAYHCYCDASAKGIEPRRVYRGSQASRDIRLHHRDIPLLARAGGAVIARGLNDDGVGVF